MRQRAVERAIAAMAERTARFGRLVTPAIAEAIEHLYHDQHGGLFGRSSLQRGTVISARVIDAAGRIFDPCDVTYEPPGPPELPYFSVQAAAAAAAERFNPETTLVGGEIATVEPTRFLLSRTIRDAAMHTNPGYRDDFEPLILHTARGTYRIEAGARYFIAGSTHGADLVPTGFGTTAEASAATPSDPIAVCVAYVQFPR